jgi:hypothetical protein
MGMNPAAAGRSLRLQAALLVAFVTIAVGVAGIVYPDALMALRRSYFATPRRFYAAGAVRLAMGLLPILAASRSRWPRSLRALGALMCLQAVAATIMGLEHARAIMEWEAIHPALLRVGAVVALVSGGVIALAVAGIPSFAWPRVDH